MQDAILAADLGPNPAPVVELAWALYRQRGLRLVEARLLTNAHGERYRYELQQGLELLRGVLDPAVLPEGRVRIGRVRDAGGRLVDDELSQEDADAWTRARWDNFKRAVDDAGDRPVVFGLVGGRRRTMGALTAAMYQLLGRDQDLCVDVRVSERRVEGARAGFFFPEQPTPCADEGGPIDPAAVSVQLVTLRLPRLRRILHEHDLRTYDQALAATGVAMDQARLPRLVVDVARRRVTVDDVVVELTEGQLIWYAALALARRGSSHGWVASDAHDALLLQVMRVCAAGRTAWRPRSTHLRRILDGQPVPGEDLSKLKADTSRRLREHCRKHALVRQDLVVPQKARRDGNRHHQRIALPKAQITIDVDSPA